MEIILGGCEHYGVNKDHVAWLKTLKTTPRKKVEEFQGWEVPAGTPEWTLEEA